MKENEKKIEHEEDFIFDDVIEFEVDGKKFKFKPVNAGDETSWLNEIMYESIEIIENKKVSVFKQDLGKRNICKMRNLVDVPYSKQLIKKLISINKSWKDLDNNQRWNVLRKLKPSVFSRIMKEINKLDNFQNKVLKN